MYFFGILGGIVIMTKCSTEVGLAFVEPTAGRDSRVRLCSHPTGLDVDPKAQERMLDDACAHLRVWFHTSKAPSPGLSPSQVAPLLRRIDEPLPVHGSHFGDLLAFVFDELTPASPTFGASGDMAYVPSGALFESAIADLIAAATNRLAGVGGLGAAHAEIEATVLRWFATMVGYPDTSRGFLSSGGSIANLSAIITARDAVAGGDLSRATAYLSDQTHYSIAKGLRLAGIPGANVRLVPTNDDFRMPLDRLDKAIEDDRRSGLRPFLIVGNAGTTNTGTVDPLRDISEIAARHRIWFHVDAAYGGFFTLTALGRQVLDGIHLSDSITVDPHKGLSIPFGAGALLVRDGEDLKRSFSNPAECLPDEDAEVWDFRNLSPELCRNFRGLRIWLPIKHHGIEAFSRDLEEKLDLARMAFDAVRRMRHVEIIAEPDLSTFAFRLRPPGYDAQALDGLNKAWLAAVNRRERTHLSGTTVRDTFVVRMCVLSHRTKGEHVRDAVEDLVAAASDALALSVEQCGELGAGEPKVCMSRRPRAS